jgi:hypothetical protein
VFIELSRLVNAVALCMLVGCSGDGPTPPGPPLVTLEPRRGSVMVYDEARHQLILFGGWGAEEGAAASDRNSTWAWSGTAWTRLTTVGPSPRHNAVAVYDATRQRIVLFGGIAGVFPSEQILSDTWEWNGTSWARVADTGPSARVHIGMGYDRARSRTVLYGGFSTATATELRDIWEWNGTTWTQQPVSGPANTVARGVGYDEKGGALILLSAAEAAPGTVHMDSWNGTTLTRLTVTAPDCVSSPVSLGATRGGFLSANWCQSSGAFRTDVWNGSAWTSVGGSQPAARMSHAVAYDRDRDRLVLFGGESVPSGALLGDLWEFNGSTWAPVAVNEAQVVAAHRPRGSVRP